MKTLTERQQKYWRARMRKTEKRIVEFYGKYPTAFPDGSFVMHAFRSGLRLGLKKGKSK